MLHLGYIFKSKLWSGVYYWAQIVRYIAVVFNFVWILESGGQFKKSSSLDCT